MENLPLKIALEYELSLHHLNGTIANLAPLILNDPSNLDQNGKTIIFHHEGKLDQIEWNSSPTSNLDLLCQEFLKVMDWLQERCDRYGLIAIPISETGTGEGKPNPLPKIKGRTLVYNAVLGEEAVSKLIKNSGIHWHIDQHERVVDQVNLLQALIPSQAMISSSSISPSRRNGINCHRYDVFSNPKTGAFSRFLSQHPEQLRYFSSLTELNEAKDCWYNWFLNEWVANGNDSKIFQEYFNKNNTGYSDIRIRPDVGQGTLEYRIGDATTFDIVLAWGAFLLGIMNRVFGENLPVYFAKKQGEYEFGDKEIILPRINLVRKWKKEGIISGLKNEEIRRYNESALRFSKEWFEEKQRHYFNPLEQMLSTGINLADEIMNYLNSLGHSGQPQYTIEQVKRATLYTARKQQQALGNFRNYHGMN